MLKIRNQTGTLSLGIDGSIYEIKEMLITHDLLGKLIEIKIIRML
jgi:hypothetical protein